jgi:hypothetical protein
MFISKKHLSRRAVLRGAGTAISLPLLDAMIPASTALAQTAAAQTSRLAYVYFPHGAVMKYWVPKQTGAGFEYPAILKPLESLNDYVTVVSGLRNKGGESSNPHGIIEETWRCSPAWPEYCARVAGTVRRTRWCHQLPYAAAAAAAGRQSAQGVLHHVRSGR